MKLTKGRILGFMAASLLLAPVFASTVAEGVGTNVRALVQANLTLSNLNTGNTDLTITGGTGVKQSINKDVVTVATNDVNGYTLKLQDSDASNALCVTPSGSCTGIPATSATAGAPALMSTANLWGYHLDDGTTFWCSTATNCGGALTLPVDSAATSAALKFAKVQLSSGTADTLKTTAINTAGDNTNIFYGVNVDASQASGTYSDTVVYTAIAN